MDNPERITYFAETDARNSRVKFGIKAKDRGRHMYVIGKTGMGKSTLLENMAIQDIQNGEGLAFIDPHGSSAEKLLDYVPEERVQDILYFAPFDMDHPIAFNVMEDVGYDKRHLVVSGLMSVFKKIWVDAWSARMEYILSNTLLALLEYPDSTLLDVNRMYVDKAFRKKVVEAVKDPLVKAFWEGEFATYTDRYTQEATPAIQNKIGQFTSNPLVRNIVGQAKSTFDFRELMDGKKVFIANLSKGRIGETNAILLGSMLTTKIYLSAMSRADATATALTRLPNFYFYVDEFQSVANQSFADILSEARKYKLNLLIAHQYIEQMEEEVRDAVFGNVGTTICFRVGPFDAEVLETVFAPKFTAQDLVNLGFAQVYLTLMIDGIGSPPFSAKTLPPIPPPHLSYRDQIIAATRKNFSHPRSEIEANILTDLAKPPPPPSSLPERRAADRPSERRGDRGREFAPPPKGGGRDERNDQRGERRDKRRDRENRPSGGAHRDHTTVIAERLKERVVFQQKKEEKKEPSAEHRQELRSALQGLIKQAASPPARGPESAPPRAPEGNSRPASSSPPPAPPPPSETPKKNPPSSPKSASPPEIPEDVLRSMLEVKKKP